MPRQDVKPSHFPPYVHVLSQRHETGLATDRHILEGALHGARIRTLRFDAHGYPPESRKFRLKRLLTPRLWSGKLDANVFLERIDPAWFRMARKQVLVPNQEWLREECRALLPHIDLVLCKTRHAEDVFRKLGCNTSFISFSSPDRPTATGMPAFPPLAHYAVPRFLHLAGASLAKGTASVFRVWARHPEWPVLTVVLRSRLRDALHLQPLSNVRFVESYLSDDELGRTMSQCNVHLCPSEAEGWGHSIVEAMGCAASVLTTDAPPMNEIVQAGRGLLVPFVSQSAKMHGAAFQVSEADLEAAIDRLLNASTEERLSLGHSGRRWYDDNELRFRTLLAEAFARVT